MEFIRSEEMVSMVNPGVVSRQLLNPDNSASRRVTITQVHVQAGAAQPRHTHEASEQIWYALQGRGMLLLADGEKKEFRAGDVARFAEREVHGLENDAEETFVYLSVTAPPIHFGYAYQEAKPGTCG